jgi:hypothetical protein
LVEKPRYLGAGARAHDRLRHRLGHRGDVALLQGELSHGAIALHEVALDLPQDEDRRGRVGIGAGDAGERVGRPGTVRHEGDARRAVDTREPIGRERRALLVVHGHELDALLSVDSVQQRRDHAAGQREDMRDVVLSEPGRDIVADGSRCLDVRGH